MLHEAVCGGNLKIIKKFFNNFYANIEVDGHIALDYACAVSRNFSKIIEMFCENEAYYDWPLYSDNESTMLFRSINNSKTEAVKCLLAHGADINNINKDNSEILYQLYESNAFCIDYAKTFQEIGYHLVKLEAAELKISDSNLQLLNNLKDALLEYTQYNEVIFLLDEHYEHLQRYKEEIKKLKEENKPLYDLLKESNIDKQINIWIKRKSEKAHKNGKRQKITLDIKAFKEELKDTYQEYGGMIIYKINQIEKEIFTRNNKPLIDTLSKYYGWYGLQNISYSDLVMFLTENKDDLTEKLRGYGSILGGSQIKNKTENGLPQDPNVNIVDCNDNLTTPPLSLRVLTAAAYINSKLDYANVQQEAYCKKR